jgi:N-acetylglucosaminyldiphosphoundecaprenol N-acetyl-beta-D-mannosaminyltransferase
MNSYFNINIEFDKNVIDNTIQDCIKASKKGYVCVVDGNVLATTYTDDSYKSIVNGGLVNTCDGSSIALIASKIHGEKFSTYTGPELFSKYIKENYRQYFLGNTEENLQLLRNRFLESGYNVDQFKMQSLPFKKVEDFDYKSISNEINAFSPDIIWVSLGAPKQEIFISKLYPFLNKGVAFAIGAAFNLFLGVDTNKRAPKFMRNMHLEWLFRVFQEPKRVGKRAFSYLIILPRLILQEIKHKNKQ